MSSKHEPDIYFECNQCGANNEVKIITNGHYSGDISIRCQGCSRDLTNEEGNELYLICNLGCRSVISYGYTASVIDHFRQVHTAYCEPAINHIGCDKDCNLALDPELQAHDDEVNDTEDPTTVNSKEKEVMDLAMEPDVAGREKLNCKQCGERFNQKTNLEKHMSSIHEDDVYFRCNKCGTDNMDKIVTNGHIKSNIRCQNCYTDLTNKEEVIIVCNLGCIDVIFHGYTASLTDHLRQVHTAYCEPAFDHIGCDKDCKLALDLVKQAQDDEVNGTEDPTTVNSKEKEVLNLTMEPDVAIPATVNTEEYRQARKLWTLERQKSTEEEQKIASCDYDSKTKKKVF